MRLLGLDLGNRRTGVAYFDSATELVLPLETIRAKSDAELIAAILVLVSDRKIDRLILGLPRLPSGDEGEQAASVRSIGERLSEVLPVAYIDERHTSLPSREKNASKVPTVDADSWAACQILETYVSRGSQK